MKNLISLLFSLSVLVSLSAQAENLENEQLLRFAKAIGIYEQIEEQIVAVQSQGAQAAQQYAQQITTSIPGLPEEFSKYMEHEFEIYMSNIASLVDTEFAVNTYIQLISEKLTAQEINRLTEFYESDLGKKFTRSNTEIMGDWTKAFMGDFDKKLIIHLQRFTNNLLAKAESYKQKN